jgi:putrescine transport system substrate-binding protein
MLASPSNWVRRFVQRVPAAFAAIALLACGAEPDSAPAAHTSQQVVYFANWDGEIGPTTHADFTRRTGIRVVPAEIVDNASLQTRLLVGRSGLDVVVSGSNFIEPLIAAGALQPLDKRKLANWNNLDPAMLAALERIDPGNRYGVPYVWGTQAFAYNVAAVERALGAPAPNSWRLMFDPVYASRLADCGIAWQDGGGSIMLDLGLLALRLDPAAESESDLRAVEAAFHQVRPYIRYVDSSARFRSDLANGEICMATGASGDLLQSQALAREAGTGVEVRYVIPEEGALLWVDLLAIPADAPNVDAAHRLIDYLLEPAVIAAVTNASKFAHANRHAMKFVAAEVASNPLIFPPDSVRARLRLVPAESATYSRLRTAAWTRIRTARPTKP